MDEFLDKIFKLNELEGSNQSDLKILEEIGSNNEIIEYQSNKLKCQIWAKSERVDLPLAKSELSSTTVVLIHLIKTGRKVDNLEKIVKYILENSDDHLHSILLIKSILKHSENNLLLLDCLEKQHDPFKPLLSPLKTTYVDYYLFNKYLRCVRLLLEKKSINDKQEYIEAKLNYIIDSDFVAKLSNQPKNVIISNLILKCYEILVYLCLYSAKDLSSDRIERLKSTLIDGSNFKPDLIYSGLSDDTQQIEFNLTCLERFISTEKRTNIAEYFLVSSVYLNPSRLFYQLASSIHFDCELVIEWLITTETRFLIYFLKYLKYLFADLNQHKLSNLERMLDSREHINRLFGFLANVQAKLSSLKRSFPYNCEPLLKLLGKILNEFK